MHGTFSARNHGLSMTEVLIVVAIIGVLFVALMGMLRGKQIDRARDSQRKDDLQKIKVAFEEYYSDNGCYPPPDILKDCSGTGLRPYLSSIPCDPLNDPYVYMPYPSTANTCKGFRVYTALQWQEDPVISQLNCIGGCGLPADTASQQGAVYDASSYNYGVSEGTPVSYRNYSGTGLSEGYCCPLGATFDCQAWDDPTDCDGQPPYETRQACLENTTCTEAVGQSE